MKLLSIILAFSMFTGVAQAENSKCLRKLNRQAGAPWTVADKEAIIEQMAEPHDLILSIATLVSMNQANASAISAAESVCLESAVNQIIASTDADLHLVRDPKTGLISRLIDLDSDESFDLAYVAVNNGVEFLSFENPLYLFNIWAKPTASGVCEVLEVRIDNNDGGI